MPIPRLSPPGLLKKCISRSSASVLLESGDGLTPNLALKTLLEGFEGNGLAFSWTGADTRGKLFLDWTDDGGRRRGFSSDSCRVQVLMPDGPPVRIAALGHDSYGLLYAVAAAFYACFLLSDSFNSKWARGALNSIPYGVALKNAELCYIESNAAFKAVCGMSACAGKKDSELPWADKAALIRSSDARALVEDMPESAGYFTSIHKNGRLQRFRIHSLAARCPGDEFLALACVFEDMTALPHTPDSLLYSTLQSKRPQQEIFDRSSSVAVVFDKDGAGIEYITGGIERYGFSPSRLTAERSPLFNLLTPQSAQKLRELLAAVAPGQERSFSAVVAGPGDKQSTLKMYLRCVGRGDGPVMEGMMTDITGLTRLQEDLREKSRSVHDRLSRVLEHEDGSQAALSSLIDMERLERHQNIVSSVFGVSAFVMNGKGRILTPASGFKAAFDYMEDSRGKRPMHERLREYVVRACCEKTVIKFTCPFTGLQGAAVPLTCEKGMMTAWIVSQIRPDAAYDRAAFSGFPKDGLDTARARELFTRSPEAAQELFQAALDNFSRLAGIVAQQINRESHLLRQVREARRAEQKIKRSIAKQRLIGQCYDKTMNSSSLTMALEGILALCGGELGFSRTYLMEKRAAGLLTVTLEWNAPGIKPIPWEYRVIPEGADTGISYSRPGLVSIGPRKAAQIPRFAATGVQNSIHLPIFSDNAPESVIVFENCGRPRSYSRQDLDFFGVIMRMILSVMRRINAENLLGLSRAAMGSVLHNLELAVMVYDPASFNILFINDYCLSLAGARRDGLMYAWEILPDVTRISAKRLARGPYTAETSSRGRVQIVTYDRLTWIDGREVFFASATDVTDNRAREKLIESLAYSDTLLGIFNRRKFEADIKEAIDRVRNGGPGGGLIYMDLDDFKLVNDSFGHHRGDALLKAICGFFQSRGDTGEKLYRLGGDEFMLLLENTGSDGLADLVEGIWERFQKPWDLGGLSVFVTVSIGVSRFPEDGDAPGELLRFADVAMYKAKYEGKNASVFFRKGLESGLSQRMQLESRLKEAVAGGFKGFEIHYQPIISLTDGEVAGAEALLRWRDGEGRVHYPGAFLPAAESAGLMGRLGGFVLRNALKDMSRYGESGHFVVVNMSLREFQSGQLPSVVSGALSDAGMPPERLVLGVNESAASFELQSGDNTLERLRSLGVRVSLDNKGTSYGALSDILRAHLDLVNIDISLIGSMQHDRFVDTVVYTSIELAKAAGCMVLCSGVEVQEQYLDLREYGCDYALGYYFSKAMPIDEYDGYIKDKSLKKSRGRKIHSF